MNKTDLFIIFCLFFEQSLQVLHVIMLEIPDATPAGLDAFLNGEMYAIVTGKQRKKQL